MSTAGGSGAATVGEGREGFFTVRYVLNPRYPAEAERVVRVNSERWGEPRAERDDDGNPVAWVWFVPEPTAEDE